MKDVSQTQSEADTPIVELLECENTLSSRKASASEAGDEEIQHGTFSKSEARWIDSGERTLSTWHIILYSAKQITSTEADLP